MEATKLAKRKQWPVPFSQTEPHFTFNNWLKFFSVVLFAYLLFYTRNPIGGFFNMSGTTFLNVANGWTRAVVVFGGVLYCAIIFAGAVWAAGWDGLSQLFASFRWRDIWYVFAYGILYLIATTLGGILGDLVPIRFGVDFVNTLEAAQFGNLGAFSLISFRAFFMTLATQLTAVMIFLASQQLFSRLATKHRRWALFLTYLLALAVTAVVTTTPLAPHVFVNIASGLVAQLPLYWVYRRSRNILVVTLSAFILMHVMIGLAVMLG
ncbi:hypothetical protein Lpp123_00969 [Lacticaseibacillus paracasei subsp. paracasei Lpp123]|uniref:Uncharacterized protein n=1 Tax=Lacticaseibacillus paracasei subsp. paracasei Lpp123 TaxID=1256201 RepID=A0A829GKY4_LACPA|nr:hypothetical protein Lpp123_00969 [Lacticaseibacillus paracasei subsp. paracasei Lpp123]